MKSYRTNAVMAGALYILGTAAGILSIVAVGGFPDKDFLIRIAADPSRITVGAFLIVVMGLSLAAMTLFLYPLFRKDSEPLALGMLIFRGPLEGSLYILSSLSWLLLGALSPKIAAAGTGSTALQAVGDAVLHVHDQNGNILTFVFIIGAVCLYTSFYRTRLIPRWLSVWGLIGAVPYLAYALLRFFGIGSSLFFLDLPLAAQEMVMGFWLVIKGFSQDAIKKLDGAH